MDTIAGEFSERIKTSLKDTLRKIIPLALVPEGDFGNTADYDFLIVVDKRDEEVRGQILHIEDDVIP